MIDYYNIIFHTSLYGIKQMSNAGCLAKSIYGSTDGKEACYNTTAATS